MLSLVTLSALFGGVENRYPTVGFAKENITTIDIRTQGEWMETGLYPNSIPITFFDDRGAYDVRKFLGELHKVLKDRNEKFALICRTGSRTKVVANFLGKNGYNVINLQGGIYHSMKKLGMKLEKYSPAKRYY